MASSLPIPGGSLIASNMGGSLAYMGNTTLFSRVSLSPQAAMGEKKAKAGGASINDVDTSASTMLGNTNPPQAMNKSIRSSTTTTTFKDATQKGVLSGAGILKN